MKVWPETSLTTPSWHLAFWHTTVHTLHVSWTLPVSSFASHLYLLTAQGVNRLYTWSTHSTKNDQFALISCVPKNF